LSDDFFFIENHGKNDGNAFKYFDFSDHMRWFQQYDPVDTISVQVA